MLNPQSLLPHRAEWLADLLFALDRLPHIVAEWEISRPLSWQMIELDNVLFICDVIHTTPCRRETPLYPGGFAADEGQNLFNPALTRGTRVESEL